MSRHVIEWANDHVGGLGPVKDASGLVESPNVGQDRSDQVSLGGESARNSLKTLPFMHHAWQRILGEFAKLRSITVARSRTQELHGT